MPEQRIVTIKGEFIKLDALLKYANLVASGGEAKLEISEGRVSVNGEPCAMRGKKLRRGDVVSYAGEIIQID